MAAPSNGTLIVKVQTALSNPTLPALIYDRSREVYQTVPVNQVTKKMGGKVKLFFHARINEGRIVLEKEAPWQDW